MSFRDITLNHLQRQFGYTSLSNLLMQRAEVWDNNFGDAHKIFNEEILNVDTCIPEALDFFWGRLYKITRSFTDNLGNLLTLTDDEFREIIKIKQFGSRWNGAIESMNEFLNNLYADRGNAYMIDKLDMTVEIFVFEFPLSDTEVFLFKNKDILPRPAGVGVDIFETGKGKWFGFYDYSGDGFNPTTIGFGTYSYENAGQFAQYTSPI